MAFDTARRGSCFYMDYDPTAGVALLRGQEVKVGANDTTVALATDANTGIGVMAADYPSDWDGKVSVAMFGSRVELVVGNGTVTAGTRAVSAGNGKFTNAGATPDGRTVRGIFLKTSAVDGDLVPMLVL